MLSVLGYVQLTDDKEGSYAVFTLVTRSLTVVLWSTLLTRNGSHALSTVFKRCAEHLIEKQWF
jgi:hypothetical protein